MATKSYSTSEVATQGGVSKVTIYERVNEILGYDLEETAAVRQSGDLYARAVTRLTTNGKTVPAEEVLGDLDK